MLLTDEDENAIRDVPELVFLALDAAHQNGPLIGR
jgi:hypothetical protein